VSWLYSKVHTYENGVKNDVEGIVDVRTGVEVRGHVGRRRCPCDSEQAYRVTAKGEGEVDGSLFSTSLLGDSDLVL